jgi:tetratricopeptide (TPR) repeat protein
MSAITEYTLALDKQYNNFDTAKKSFNARVIFSWIELDNQLKRTSERDSLITILTTKYGESVYASMAGHLYSGETKKDSPGEKAYSDAYAVLRRGGLDAAKGQMLGVVTSYSHEDVAPRALYAIGIAYEDISRYDSALYYYKRVVNEYPYSSYADELKPRLLAAMGPAKTAPTTTTTTKSNAPPAQSQTVKPPVTPGTADDQNAQTNMTTEQSDDKHPILQSAPNMKVQRDSVIIPVPNAKKIKK